MEPTDDNILALIAANGGIQAKVIASKLGTDKKTINSALYSRLRTKVKQDNEYGLKTDFRCLVDARDNRHKPRGEDRFLLSETCFSKYD